MEASYHRSPQGDGMKVIAEETVKRYLVELEEDEVEDAEAGGFPIIRAEGSDPPDVPRLWIEAEDMPDLVGACYGDAGAHDYRKTIAAMKDGVPAYEAIARIGRKKRPS